MHYCVHMYRVRLMCCQYNKRKYLNLKEKKLLREHWLETINIAHSNAQHKKQALV